MANLVRARWYGTDIAAASQSAGAPGNPLQRLLAGRSLGWLIDLQKGASCVAYTRE